MVLQHGSAISTSMIDSFTSTMTGSAYTVNASVFGRSRASKAQSLATIAPYLESHSTCRTFSLNGTALLAISRRRAIFGSSETLSRVQYFCRKSSFCRAGTNNALHDISSRACDDKHRKIIETYDSRGGARIHTSRREEVRKHTY